MLFDLSYWFGRSSQSRLPLLSIHHASEEVYISKNRSGCAGAAVSSFNVLFLFLSFWARGPNILINLLSYILSCLFDLIEFSLIYILRSAFKIGEPDYIDWKSPAFGLPGPNPCTCG